MQNWRADYEAAWINEMYKFVVNALNPEYFQKLAKGKTPRVSSKDRINEIDQQLESHNFKLHFINASLCKAMNLPEKVLIMDTNKEYIDRSISRISAYFTAYKTIIRKIMTEGYSVRKNKNDFNDLHFLLYLGMGEDIVFISYDDKLIDKIEESHQATRVMKINDLM